MATNFTQPGDVLELTAPSGGVTKSVAHQIGELIVIPLSTAAEGETFQGATRGVWSGLAKATGAAWTVGAVLYWDGDTFTTVASENQRAGVAAAAAGSDDTTGSVRLDGTSLPTAEPT